MEVAGGREDLFLLHLRVVGSFSAFGRRPCDDLIRIGNITRFAVNAVFVMNEKLFETWVVRVRNHFIHRGWAEVFAGVPVVSSAVGRANVSVSDFKMGGLVDFMLRATESNKMLLAKREHAIEFKLFLLSFRDRKLPYFLHGGIRGMEVEVLHEASAPVSIMKGILAKAKYGDKSAEASKFRASRCS